MSLLARAQLEFYRTHGHLTVPGVSCQHANTFHRSGPNLSACWRRACALHYVGNATVFGHPALPYNHALKLRIS